MRDMEPIIKIMDKSIKGLQKLIPLKEVVISIKSWRNTDKYPCPKCEKKLGMPDYTCKDCNIKLKPVMNF